MPANQREEIVGLPRRALLRGPFEHGNRLWPEWEDELGGGRLGAGEQTGVAAQVCQPIEHLRRRGRELEDFRGVAIQADGVIPHGQLEEGLVRQLVADQAGDVFGTRLAAQVALAAGEVAQGVKLEQANQRVVRSGLQAGDEIVVNGLERVRPGMQVTAQKETLNASLTSRQTASR